MGLTINLLSSRCFSATRNSQSITSPVVRLSVAHRNAPRISGCGWLLFPVPPRKSQASSPAPTYPYTCAKNRHHQRQPSCFPVVKGFSQNSRTGGPVLRARLGVAVRHWPILALGAPQPSTQSAGRGSLCACLATEGSGRVDGQRRRRQAPPPRPRRSPSEGPEAPRQHLPLQER